MKIGSRSLLLSALVLATGCAGSADETESRASRRIVPTTWRVEWQRGGSEGDTLFHLPIRVATDGELVYVLDRFASRVVALRASDGAVAWKSGRKGTGPGELDAPTAIAALPGGGVAVADPNNRRVTFLTATGAVDGTLALPLGSLVGSMCALDDGSLLVANALGTDPLVRIARNGAVIGRPAMPWEDLRGPASLRSQAVLGRAHDGRGCVVALGLGRGFASYDGERFHDPHAYVESFDLPEVEVKKEGWRVSTRVGDSPPAATSVAALGDTIAVAFVGRSTDAGRLVDLYDGSTGRYVRSYLGPGIESMAAAGGRLFVLTQLQGYPAVLAQTIRPEG